MHRHKNRMGQRTSPNRLQRQQSISSHTRESRMHQTDKEMRELSTGTGYSYWKTTKVCSFTIDSRTSRPLSSTTGQTSEAAGCSMALTGALLRELRGLHNSLVPNGHHMPSTWGTAMRLRTCIAPIHPNHCDTSNLPHGYYISPWTIPSLVRTTGTNQTPERLGQATSSKRSNVT